MTALPLFQVAAHFGSAPVQRHQFGIDLLDQHPGHGNLSLPVSGRRTGSGKRNGATRLHYPLLEGCRRSGRHRVKISGPVI